MANTAKILSVHLEGASSKVKAISFLPFSICVISTSDVSQTSVFFSFSGMVSVGVFSSNEGGMYEFTSFFTGVFTLPHEAIEKAVVKRKIVPINREICIITVFVIQIFLCKGRSKRKKGLTRFLSYGIINNSF